MDLSENIFTAGQKILCAGAKFVQDINVKRFQVRNQINSDSGRQMFPSHFPQEIEPSPDPP